MNTVLKCKPKDLQFGDKIVINHHVWLITSITGPDQIGTYDLYLKDVYGNQKQEIVSDSVTLLM